MVLLLSWTERVMIFFMYVLVVQWLEHQFSETQNHICFGFESQLRKDWRGPFSVMSKYWGTYRPPQKEAQLRWAISKKFFFLMGFWIFGHFVIITFPHLSCHFEKKKKFGHEIFFWTFLSDMLLNGCLYSSNWLKMTSLKW